MEGEAIALADGGRRRPHVLLFPFPSEGHINPILDLGRRFVASGLLATLVLTPGLFRKQQQQQQQQQQEGPFDPPLLRFEALDLAPELDAAISSPKVLDIVDSHLVAPFRSLLLARTRSDDGDDSLDGGAGLPPISCLVCDSFMPWTIDLAAELDIPRAEMWTASASAYLMGVYMPELFARGLLPFKQGTEDLPLDFIPAISGCRLGHVFIDTLAMSSASASSAAQEELVQRLQEFLRRIFARGAESKRVFVNSFRELEDDAVAALRGGKGVAIAPIGPTLGAVEAEKAKKAVESGWESESESESESEDCVVMRWLDKREARSVVYVAFGSTGVLTEEEVAEVAAALETVHQPFLWAIREGSATESLPPAFRAANLAPESGLIVAWAPQRRVLEHSSVGVFVSHCGWNSLLESVWSGIPVVGCPRIAEQNLNLWLLQEWGIGVSGVDTITGGKGSVRRATLAAAVRRATHPSLWSELRERAAGLAAAARAAVSPSGSSTRTFQEFVEELLQTS